MVLKVRVKSRLFLVGPALLAISVSRRAEGEGAGLEGPDFLFCNLPPISLFSFPPPLYCLLTTPADLTITSRQGFALFGCTGTCFAGLFFLSVLDCDSFKRLLGVTGFFLTR